MKIGETEISGEALKLEAGCIYAIQLDRQLSMQGYEDLSHSLRQAVESTGIRFIILGPDMRIVRRGEVFFDPSLCVGESR